MSRYRSPECMGVQSHSRQPDPRTAARQQLFPAGIHLRLAIVLDTNALDEIELGLEVVDMLFLGLENRLEQLARNEFPEGLAIADGCLELGVCRHLELEVALETFLHPLSDEQLSQVLQVGQPVEKENPLDETVGMLHLIDRLTLLVLLEAHQTPIAEHARMQKILVDRRELVLQHGVQMLKYLGIALHAHNSMGFFLEAGSWGNAPRCATLQRTRCAHAAARAMGLRGNERRNQAA